MPDSKQFIVVSIHNQSFGIEIIKVKEVVAFTKITPLPNVHPFVKGVINLRGLILPVFDLKEKFHLPLKEYTPQHVIVVVEILGRVMGIIVEEISDVVDLPSSDVQDISNLPPAIPSRFIKGLGKKDNELIILLDLDRLLDLEDLEVLEKA